MMNTNLSVLDTYISKCKIALFFLKVIFLALDEEIKMHLFSCFTALCLFTVRIYLERTQLKDTLERDLGSAALQYFSSLVLLKN